MRSPIVHRHRAERLLREQFEGQRELVLASVRRRLRAGGASLDRADLEAAYAIAWQGLYMALLEGEEVANPTGWLVVVTHRRALDEHRAHARARCAGELAGELGGETSAMLDRGDDLAAELDDRARLRQLFEGLRHRLDAREREAATLCYLQGLSRAEAADRMGISEARMRKLMEGRGPGRQGVAGKVGALVRTIAEGGWCEEQGSLMRALAFGILDPAGERHRLALAHSSACPACRAYVVSLRGLAVALPPVFLPGSMCAAALAHLGGGSHAVAGSAAAGPGSSVTGGAHAGGGAGAGTRAGLQAGRIGGAVSASGAAGAGGAAGGGWLMGAGPFTAKLAVSCLLALGVGAGCVTLGVGGHAPPPRHVRRLARSSPASGASLVPGLAYEGAAAAGTAQSSRSTATAASAPSASAGQALTPAAMASREFGPEQALASAPAETSPASAAAAPPRARAAASDSASPTDRQGAAAEPALAEPASEATTEGNPPREGDASEPAGEPSGAPSSSGDSVAAEREFSPG